MVEATDIYITGSVQNAQSILAQVFQTHNFTVEWKDAFNGKAKQGSKGANFALGALAQYYEQDFQIIQNPDQTLVIRVIKATSGWTGGLAGAMKVKAKYNDVVDFLTMYFQQQGLYRGRNPP
jgi:hypothetical protein